MLDKNIPSTIAKDPRVQAGIGKYIEGNKKISQKPSCILNKMPFSLDKILDKLDVNTLHTPIINTDQLRRDDINFKTYNRPVIPRKTKYEL